MIFNPHSHVRVVETYPFERAKLTYSLYCFTLTIVKSLREDQFYQNSHNP